MNGRALTGGLGGWAVLIIAAAIAREWLVVIGLAIAPAALGVTAAVTITARERLLLRRAARRAAAAGDAPDGFDPERTLELGPYPKAGPRRPRAPRPTTPPADQNMRPPLTPWASARIDQELTRRRQQSGDPGADYADFVELMRNAGAGDLEDVDE